MQPNTLFPRPSRASVSGDVARPSAPVRMSGIAFSAEELNAARRAFLERGTRIACPRCGTAVTTRRTPTRAENGEVTWIGHCETCRQALPVRVPPRGSHPALRLNTLVASKPTDTKVGQSVSRTILSVVVHSGIIYAGILATQSVAEGPAVRADTSVVFLAETNEPEVEREEPPALASLAPPPQGFQTLAAPIDVPTDIPPVDLTQRFDARDYTGKGVEGGVFTGVEGGQVMDLSQTFAEAAVDEPPERLAGPPLQYPPGLRAAAVEGYVVVEFVVDTTGVAEPSSIRVLESSHSGFEQAAIDAIRGSRFRPGRMRGFAVRVLVQQRIGFSLR